MEENSNGFTVTLKGGRDYADPWLVVRAYTRDEMFSKLCDAADIDKANAEKLGLSLNQLTVLAASDFARQWSLRNTLGAAVIDGNVEGVKDATPPAEVTVIETGKTKAAAEKAKAEEPVSDGVPQEIKDALINATSTSEIGKVWQAHRAAYDASPAIQQAFKDRSAEIKAQG